MPLNTSMGHGAASKVADEDSNIEKNTARLFHLAGVPYFIHQVTGYCVYQNVRQHLLRINAVISR